MPVRESVQLVFNDRGLVVHFQAQCDLGAAIRNTDYASGGSGDKGPVGGWRVCQKNDAQTNSEIDENYQAVLDRLNHLAPGARAKPTASGNGSEQDPQPQSGCANDMDCKGDRICEGRKCVEPNK